MVSQIASAKLAQCHPVALVYATAGRFPLVAVWIPPFQYSDLDVHDITSGLPWDATGLLSWIMLTYCIVYWFSFRLFLPRIRPRKGKEFVVEREPVFRMQNGERVQSHEIVLHSWVIKAQSEKRTGYMLDDL